MDRGPHGDAAGIPLIGTRRPAVTVSIETSCTACGACLVTCPTGALVAAPHRPVVSEPECIDCLACIEVCPVDAIRWGGLRGGGGAGIRL